MRVVILNHGGGELVLPAIESLEHTDWPRQALELVLFDNGATDGGAAFVRARFPGA